MVCFWRIARIQTAFRRGFQKALFVSTPQPNRRSTSRVLQQDEKWQTLSNGSMLFLRHPAWKTSHPKCWKSTTMASRRSSKQLQDMFGMFRPIEKQEKWLNYRRMETKHSQQSTAAHRTIEPTNSCPGSERERESTGLLPGGSYTDHIYSTIRRFLWQPGRKHDVERARQLRNHWQAARHHSVEVPWSSLQCEPSWPVGTGCDISPFNPFLGQLVRCWHIVPGNPGLI